MLHDNLSSKTVDRLPVLIFQPSGMQLLGVPKMEASTGEENAEIVYEILNQWNAIDGIVAMSFDTTPANSGRFKGACALLEQKRRSLLKHV